MTTDIVLPARPSGATTIEQSRARAEVEAAIFVAQQFPRNTLNAWAEMRAACGRLALASRAFYAVPNRGSGKSVHLARELARIWGNIDYGVKELHRDDTRGESEVLAHSWDQQTNTRSTRSLIVPHAKMAGGGRKLLVDLGDIYLNNQNIGARAVRECIFSVLPADFAAEAEDICRATIEKGDGQPLDKRIEKMVDAFAALGMGIDVARMESRLGRKRGLWTPADVADLGVVYSSLKRGEVTAEDAFPPPRVTAEEITTRKRRTAPPPPIDEGDELLPHEWTAEKAFRVLGVTDPGEQMRYVCEAVGRSVGSINDLSESEHRTLMQKLANWMMQEDLAGGDRT